MAQIKRWRRAGDPILADLAERLLNRRLFKTLEIDTGAPDAVARIESARRIVERAGLDPRYYFLRVDASETPYTPYDLSAPHAADHIFIENGHGGIVDVAALSPTIEAFTKTAYRLTRLVFPTCHAGADLRGPVEACFTD
jgi:uncharacterized protein